MKRIRRILVYTDGSECSDAAVKLAGRLAVSMKADIKVLYVREIPHSVHKKYVRRAREKVLEWGLELPAIRELKHAKMILEDVDALRDVSTEERIAEDLVFKKILKFRKGNPVEEIIREAEERGYNLVVLGSHRGNLDSFSVGTVTHQVAEYVKLPTLVVKKDAEVKNMLVCTDGSKSAEEAVHCGGYLAKKLGAKVTVLSVAHGTVEPTYTGTAAISEDLEREFKKEAKKAIENAAKIIDEFGLTPKTKIRVGSAEREILKEAKNYDLVVLGSRGLGKIKRLLIGQVSLNVLEHSETNVLIVRNCILYR